MLISCLMTSFVDWLNSQLAERKMSPADLARSMKKDQGIVSRILRGERKPSPETLEAISKALKLPVETVFQAAGILPTRNSDLSPKKRELLNRLEGADEETIQDTIDMLETALKMQQRRAPGGNMQKVKG